MTEEGEKRWKTNKQKGKHIKKTEQHQLLCLTSQPHLWKVAMRGIAAVLQFCWDTSQDQAIKISVSSATWKPKKHWKQQKNCNIFVSGFSVFLLISCHDSLLKFFFKEQKWYDKENVMFFHYLLHLSLIFSILILVHQLLTSSLAALRQVHSSCLFFHLVQFLTFADFNIKFYLTRLLLPMAMQIIGLYAKCLLPLYWQLLRT